MANFLGKKISLISKAGIRYEGILYTIDQTAFTVALSKVKSFGTEERTTDRFIAARDEVYEYIIFRGSDISDLHVCENSLYTDDSAIVKIMSPNITNTSSPPILPTQPHGASTDANVQDPKPQRQEPESPVFQPSISISKRFMNFSKVNSRGEDHGPCNDNQRHYKRDQSYSDKRDPDDLEEIATQDYRQFQSRDQPPKSDFYDNFDEDSHRYSNVRRPTQRQHGFRNVESNRGSAYGRGYGGSKSNSAFRSNKEVAVDSIKDDFDFESSNALMVEELAHMNVGHGVADVSAKTEDNGPDIDDVSEEGEEPEKSFYNKSRSFFDNISSEVTDRSSGVSDRRHKNNVETFGGSEYNRGNYRGYRGNNRWNDSRGAFRGNYNRGSSVGFLRRGGNSQRGDGRMGRGGQFSQSNQRRPVIVGAGGGFSGFGQEN